MRNKKILTLFVISAVLLAGCGENKTIQYNNAGMTSQSQTDNNLGIAKNRSENDYSSYTGTYYREGDSPSSIETKGGTSLVIQSITGNKIKFTITATGSAPSNRIAMVNVDGIIGDNGIVKYSYTDDGWGNSGEGTLSLKKGELILTSHVTVNDSNAMWKLPEYNNVTFCK